MLNAVVDIGKTHIKLLVLEDGQQQACFTNKNAPQDGLYPQADTDGIWQWLCTTLSTYPRTGEIAALIVTTHGATAALVNHNAQDRNTALVLPVVDYEFDGVEGCNDDYAGVRPDFSETLSPQLPAGLNLGRQLFWLQHKFAEAFASVTHILMYPQYWAWRLGGEPASEVTSLGCHTDLWQPQGQDYSSLVDKCQWREYFPPIRNAWDELGCVSEQVAEQTGLSTTCKLYAGIHDSNASLLRYLPVDNNSNQTLNVISSGTWTIIMQTNRPVDNLKAARDTLANVDVFGHPVSCARFMGGREYETICQLLGGDIGMGTEAAAIQQAIDERWMVTPDFSQGNGPFGHAQPALLCPDKPPSPQAIATLYCALMIDQRLNDLNASGPVYIEGAFLKNPVLCQLVAQLRPHQTVMLSSDNTGTVMGAAALMNFSNRQQQITDLVPCAPATFSQLTQYKAQWYQAIATQAAQ